MKVTYRITEQDYMDAHDLFCANDLPKYRRLYYRARPWIGAGFIALQVCYLFIDPDSNRTAVLAGFIAGGYLLYRGYGLRRSFRQLYRQDKRFEHEFTADISEEGIRVVTPTEDSHMKWASFVRILESEKIFLLFHAEWLFSIFPRRAFGLAEADQFRDLLRRNVPTGNLS
jgi:hypothetical protein